MCRPSCCKPSNDGTGIAAIAIIAAGAFVAVKIGPIMAKVVHLAVEVFTIIMLTAASALMAIVAGWLTVCLVRWRNRHQPHRQITLHPVPAESVQAHADPGCLACGDTGTVLRAITGDRYQGEPCPACSPARWAG